MADAASVTRQVRAFHPRPGAFTTLRGKRLEVARARAGDACDAPPGTIAIAPLRVAAGDLWVVLEEVQLEGRRAIAGDDFARGARIGPGLSVE